MPNAISGRRDAARQSNRNASNSFQCSARLRRPRRSSPIRWSRISLLILGGVAAIAAGLGVGFCIKQAKRVRHEVASAAAVEIPPGVAMTPPPVETVAKPATPSKPAPVGFQGIRHGYPEEFRRIRSPLEAYKLQEQLWQAPEIILESKPGTAAEALLAHARENHGSWMEPAPHPPLLVNRSDFQGLPFRMGAECYLFDAQAIRLQEYSERLHTYLNEAKQAEEKSSANSATPNGQIGAEFLSSRLAMDGHGVWQSPDAVPALVQILQAEEAPYRRLLVRLLSGIRGETATESLARRAVFDLARVVREEAVYALRNRPEADYRAILLDGLRHPWSPASEFAAEAIVNLNDTAMLPQLVGMLALPDPSGPILVKSDKGEKVVVREVVQMNHLKNCLLCHAASADASDRVRGLVFDPDRQPVSTNVPYYRGSQGYFARAEVTYLRQDFSVMQKVRRSGKFSVLERFDYVVRERPLNPHELDENTGSADYPQRRAVLFALRELTGEDLASDARAWEERLFPIVHDVNGAAANHH